MTADAAVAAPLIPAWVPIVTTILLTLLVVALGALGYYVRDSRSAMTKSVDEVKKNVFDAIKQLRQESHEKDKEHDTAIEKLRGDLNKYQQGMSEKFVMRDDYVRNSVSWDNKLDDMGVQLRCVDRKLAQLIGMIEVKNGPKKQS